MDCEVDVLLSDSVKLSSSSVETRIEELVWEGLLGFGDFREVCLCSSGPAKGVLRRL